jgi:hypothetical protein
MAIRIIKTGKDIPQEILDFFEISKGAIGWSVTVDAGKPIIVTTTFFIEKEAKTLH